MRTTIKLAVIGYGNVGRGVMKAIDKNDDMELACILSRSPDRVKKELGANAPVFAADDFEALKKADVAILCGGSKDDLPVQGPFYAKHINTIDSYDNHSQALAYFTSMDETARNAGTVACVSIGWDPGTFSLERVLGNAVIPGAKTYGFYGTGPRGGLSMGHSDAIRQVEGVQDARQYTHAIPEAIEQVRSGENPELKPGDMHWRECFVVAKDGANTGAIENEIKNMSGYFAPYKTVVHFVSQEELDAKYAGFPHDGLVIGSGTTGDGNKALVEYRNTWDSNPEATANILVAHARAATRLAADGKSGAFTILDIPPAYLSPHSREELIGSFL
ncbi:MAG TPA: diaminopimelate dehydrogenase [Treponemataceae bacterium]|nr:diaminopimelate dehydrogenase [Treponemataceae bacterium]